MSLNVESSKTYTYCFSGVGLPDRYQRILNATTKTAELLFDGITLIGERVPGHVTSNYFDDLNGSDMGTVASVLAEHSPRLVGKSFNIEGLRFENRTSGFRVYVGVWAPDSWLRFIEDVNQDLEMYICGHLSDFAKLPHISIGKHKVHPKSPAKLEIPYKQKLLHESCRKWVGQIPITDLSLWGIEPGDADRIQVRRANIPVGGRSKRLFYGASVQSA